MARKITGFTLIEIMVALAVLGVMLAIAVPSYTDWQKERQLTSDTKMVLSFVQEERAKAYTTKQNIQLNVANGTTSICDGMGNCVNTEHALEATSTNISISSRGVYDNEHIRIQDDTLISEYEPASSCVSLTSTRARVGQYESGSCNAQ